MEPGLEGLPAEVPPPPPPGKRALGIALRLVGVALLALVLWKVPWRDRLHLRDGTALVGRIEREEAGAVRFVPEGGAERRYAAAELRAPDASGMPAAEEGVLSLRRRLRLGPTLQVLLIVAASVGIAALRWRLLLRTVGVELTRREAVEYTLLGNFFNQVAPGGLVGGDVLKAIAVARGRAGAAGCWVSVFVDRVVGMFGAVVLACIALLPRWSDPGFHASAVVAYGVLAGGVIGGSVALSRRLRRVLRMEQWVPRVPLVGGFLAEVDRAVLAYRERKGAILVALGLSVAIHAGWCLCNAFLGEMLGIDMTLGEWFAVVPSILVVSAVPGLPGGWGVGEAAYAFFLRLLGVPAAPAVAVSVLGRVIQAVAALPGGIVFLARRR